ncbi:right-handed parallel beta-helix repeat-containing protein [Zavarzinella formosa]|uniref:right-handed parallel beta-helix repeat-containing protein n=1 Tax=Zavarzinella formosa TaxID=360055 RepID=UPI0002EF7BB0|nr:right-handed parallel beta-helix repeat-containing protein [Zavarzinella formosa]
MNWKWNGLLLVAITGSLGWIIATRSQSQDPPKPVEKTAFGAVGDGKADDTAAIQRAIDEGRGTISLPRGIYRLTKPLLVDLDKTGFTSIEGHGTARLLMDGPGAAIRFVGTHAGTADPVTIKAPVWDRQRAPMVEGLEIVGNHPEACGIEAEGTMQITLSRLVVRKTLNAVRLYKRNRNVIISDCHLYENRGIGVFLDDVDLHQINVIGSHVSYNAGGGIVSIKGNVRNLQITGCDIEANMALPTGPATANIFIDATGSDFGTGEVAITGCTVQHTGKAAGCANVHIRGLSNPGKDMPVVRQGHVTITGNVFSDVRVNVHLESCRGVVISGNTFWEGFDHNLLVEDSHSVVVGPNSMDRNPHYDRFGNSRDAKNDVVFKNCEDCNVSGLHLTNVRKTEASMTVGNSKRFNITGCTILDGDAIGVMLTETSDSKVSGCVILDARPGDKKTPSIRVTGGRGNMVTDNLLGGAVEADPASGLVERNQVKK